MIEIVTDKERNLKNLKQIGTPKDEDKIYVENIAYAKIKEETYKDKRVFVLMGHSEYVNGRYATFVEAVIPVKEMEFLGGTPRWSNALWSEVFREIRRLYEDLIIVGWAIDIKGMSPRITTELERVHREQFGGVHQILFLLDTLEQEETFYVYKENRLVAKDGFYVYYHAKRKVMEEKVVEHKAAPVEVDIDVLENERPRSGRYRQMMQEKETRKGKEEGNMGLAVAVAMLVFVLGVGAYENRGSLFGEPASIETDARPEKEESSEEDETESTETSVNEKIPVETIEGSEEN